LKIAKDAAGFASMERAVEEATNAVRSGEALAEPLRRSGLFPDDIIEMVAVAEEANNLDTVLVSVADTVDDRVDRLLTTLVRLIEPLLLVLIAAGVVLVALGLIMAMMRLTSSVQI
jgi:general secretion pathway protein F/type IV pilus assembly protein PilC